VRSTGRLHQEKRELVEKLIEEGLTKKEISEKSGIPFGSISHYLNMWGLKTKQARKGYYHLKDQGEALISEGVPITKIAEILGIPKGSITLATYQWKTGKPEKRESHLSEEGKRVTSEALRASHRKGRRHPFKGLVSLKGKFVPPEERDRAFLECVDKDMTYAQISEELQLDPATVYKTLKKLGKLRGARKADRAYNYKGGHKKSRGPDWYTNRKLAKARDGYKCVDCGKTEEQEKIDSKRNRGLSVHHKNPYEESFDSTLENLVTLCQSCHMKREHKEGRHKK
jgi:5-methylcytosine-specific restriction endonuclease McrA